MSRTTPALAAIVALMSGCAPLSLIGGLSRTETFRTREDIQLPQGTDDPIRLIEETGKSLGYRVTDLDRGRNYISFEASSSVLEGVLFSHGSEAQLQIAATADGRRADVLLVVVGNLGTGNQEKGEKLLTQFKEALAKGREPKTGSR